LQTACPNEWHSIGDDQIGPLYEVPEAIVASAPSEIVEIRGDERPPVSMSQSSDDMFASLRFRQGIEPYS
jgi:hypothetical protein